MNNSIALNVNELKRRNDTAAQCGRKNSNYDYAAHKQEMLVRELMTYRHDLIRQVSRNFECCWSLTVFQSCQLDLARRPDILFLMNEDMSFGSSSL